MRLSDLEKFEKITIQCHDNPDADALASGYGLFCYFKAKGKDVRLVYSGRNKITKPNLRLMVEKLEIPVEYLPVDTDEKLYLPGLLVTVDCQYGSGNVTGITADEIAVIDHHQLDREAIPLCVIQSGLGSCATLVWKLLKEENYDVDSNENLSTALFYGLYTDTNQFSELYSPLDMDMREALKVDKSLITLFRNSNLSLKELEIAGIAMIRYSYNDDYEFAVIKAQPCDPNILGLISDFLLQVVPSKPVWYLMKPEMAINFPSEAVSRKSMPAKWHLFWQKGWEPAADIMRKPAASSAGSFTKRNIPLCIRRGISITA